MTPPPGGFNASSAVVLGIILLFLLMLLDQLHMIAKPKVFGANWWGDNKRDICPHQLVLRSPQLQHAPCVYTACALHAPCMHPACTLHVHCMYTACILLYVHRAYVFPLAAFASATIAQDLPCSHPHGGCTLRHLDRDHTAHSPGLAGSR